MEGESAPHSASDEAAKAKAKAYVGQILGGRYKVDSVLALGGMGAVFRAFHVHMRKHVALKLLHPTTENLPELALRFERESIVNANLTHPNVCSAMDFGRFEDGAHYLVLEYIEGRTLRDVMRDGPVEAPRAAEIVRQIADALAAAHERGIVHRDVKPSNLMLVDGPRTFVKIVDFGLAKIPAKLFQGQGGDDVRVTRSGTVFGTVAYMAPELAGGMHLVDHRSDLYALGAVFYEMLAGKHPFDAIEPTELFRQHRSKAVPPIAERAPGVEVPPALEAIVRKMLAKKPEDRYQDADELLADLDLASPPEVAPPSRPSARSPASRRGGQFSRGLEERTSAPPRSRSRIDVPDPADASPPPTRVSAAPEEEGNGRKIAIGILFVAAAMLVGIGAIRIYAPATWERFGLEPPRAEKAAPSAAAAAEPAITASAGAATAAPTESAAPSSSSSASTDADKPPGDLPAAATELRGVLREAANDHDAKRGARAMIDLAKAAPEAFRLPDVLGNAAVVAVGAETGDRSMADSVFELLGGPTLGASGPDVLFHIVCFSGGSRAAIRAGDLLAKDEVLGRASLALKVARELRAAPCKDRPALYDRAVDEGDERALSLMSAMRGPACGDTPGACCAQSDPKLAEAATKLRERLHK